MDALEAIFTRKSTRKFLDLLRTVLSRSGISWNRIRFTMRNGDVMRISMDYIKAAAYWMEKQADLKKLNLQHLEMD